MKGTGQGMLLYITSRIASAYGEGTGNSLPATLQTLEKQLSLSPRSHKSGELW